MVDSRTGATLLEDHHNISSIETLYYLWKLVCCHVSLVQWAMVYNYL